MLKESDLDLLKQILFDLNEHNLEYQYRTSRYVINGLEQLIKRLESPKEVINGSVEIIIYPDGRTSVQVKGEQRSDLQQSWLLDVLANLQNRGINLDEATILIPFVVNHTFVKFESVYQAKPTELLDQLK